MKTPEEIKRALRLCRMDEIECKQCDYEIDCKEEMGKQIDHDALELIETQEARIVELEKKLAAAMADITWMGNSLDNSDGSACRFCKHKKSSGRPGGTDNCAIMFFDENLYEISGACDFEWRGPCAKNGGKQE